MLLIGLAKPKLVCANRQASKSPPAEASLASADAFRRLASNFSSDWLFSRLLVSEANVSTMAFLDASYWSRKAETGLCQQTGSKSPPAEGSLASPDASPGIATWRSQPCVRRCSFGALRLISAVTNFSLVS